MESKVNFIHRSFFGLLLTGMLCGLIFTAVLKPHAAEKRTGLKEQPDSSIFMEWKTEEIRNVRVGFFNFDGYHIVDGNGRRSGYGYDYLQYLDRYANFKYEYIGYEKSWDDMIEMLDAGEIDLLTSAQKTEERLRRFDFSDQPIGRSAAVLTVKAGDNRYMTDDYSKLDGIRIGLLEGNSRNEGLENFAVENGFSYQPVYFEDSISLAGALQSGVQIDAALTSNLRKIDKEWIIASFDTTPFYIMVKKGNQELLEAINKAIDRIEAENPNLSTTLFQRYYSAESNEIPFTAKEREYIKEWQESGEKVKITINSGREPISYFEKGEARGIIPEIARRTLDRAGIPYEFVNIPPTVDARRLLLNKSVSARFDSAFDFNDAEKFGFRVTEPYLTLPLSCLTRKNFRKEPEKAAVIRNSDVVEEYVEQIFDTEMVTRYDSAKECLQAVLSGKQDAAFFQTYIAQRFVNNDVRNRLKEQIVPGYTMDFAIAVREDEPLLFSILNKAVLSLDSGEISLIVMEENMRNPRKQTMIAFLYDHPSLWIILLAAAACFVIFLLLIIFRSKNLKLKQEKIREFERFISYVCNANDLVMEIDMMRQKQRNYEVKDGKVCFEEKILSYDDMQWNRIHPGDRKYMESLIQKDKLIHLINTGDEEYFECRVQKEGEDSWHWMACTFQGLSKKAEKEGSLMIFIKNIDQAKQEEEEKRQVLEDALAAAKQAGEAKGAFMSRMSHEIRTPLNAIIGYLTIARSSLYETEKADDCLKKSEFAAHHLLNIINDVLDISAIESGKMKIAHEVFNLRQLLSGITSIFLAQSREKGIDFQVKLKDLTEEQLTGDQLRLNQILMNLLSNAVKFTLSGGQVTLVISQKAIADRKVFLQFAVEDTGIGMSEEYKKRLFLPFEQQDASTAQKFGGTGLGLSITKNLITMMGGTITVQSEEGRGTVFTINLSFDKAAASGRNGSDIYDFSSLHVLVLYDENGNYAYLQTLLERLGVAYHIVLNQEEALREIARKKGTAGQYDLCFLDLDIPGFDGEEAAKQLRAAGAPELPVIIAAAYDASGQSKEAASLIERVVSKPIFQSSLFDVLSNICQVRTPNAEKENERNLELSGMRILMAEDNPMNMEIAKEILTAQGLFVDCAVNGQEALEIFEQSEDGAYQAILMDIQMPVLNGYEACVKIRSSGHPQAKSIPIIALTADAFTEDINRALAAGMNDHVSKPVDFRKLCQILIKNIG